jgi:uncharacterized protein DUF2612
VSADIDDYVSLITSEHNQKPNYVATVKLRLQPYVDGQVVAESIPALFDLDVAVGQQLDFTGQWIGRTRFLETPLNIFFSWDTPGLGWDQGIWDGPYLGQYGQVALPDSSYRTLLKATVAANYWDGTVPGAYKAWDTLFAMTPYYILIQDYGNMSMAIVLMSATPPDAVDTALFTSGELDLKPATVELFHVLPTVYPAGMYPGGTPLFGWDVSNGNIAGWDQGAWADFVSSE